MTQEKKVQLIIYIPEQCRDRLRIMAAEQIIQYWSNRRESYR